ncbi:hypothetical protein J4216_01580 [Candidatus Woesearchaeota archaeon]|nr:hypothetical protein [Candidatus Woesearchaeota archaeon]
MAKPITAENLSNELNRIQKEDLCGEDLALILMDLAERVNASSGMISLSQFYRPAVRSYMDLRDSLDHELREDVPRLYF